MPALVPEGSKILLTGGNGYIGSWILKGLLERGFAVRAAVRALEKAGPLKDYFSSYVTDGKLEFVVVEDFAKENAFHEAVDGVDGIVHTAAPLALPKYVDFDFIPPILDGTLNLLSAASRPQTKVKRIVITSSTANISRSLAEPAVFDESDWANDPEKFQELGMAASLPVRYKAAKTLAEKAALDYENKIGWDVVSLNPPYVLGPMLIRALPSAASVDFWFSVVVKEGPKDAAMLSGAISYADVRDVAEAHVLSLITPDAGGERIILSAGSITWQEAIDHLNTLESTAPIKAPRTQGIKGLDGVHLVKYNSEKSKKVLGLKYRDYEGTTRDMLQELSDRGY